VYTNIPKRDYQQKMFGYWVAINCLVVLLLIYYKPIGLMVFDVLTNIYTFIRIRYEIYDPFKPVLKIHKVSYFYKKDDSIFRQTCEDFQDLYCLFNESYSLALSITYSFSDSNKKFIKLIDLSNLSNESQDYSAFLQAIYLKEIPTYNEYNYDYRVNLVTNIDLEDKDIQIVNANLEAYIHRTPTFEAEQTLEFLKKHPELMEFVYPSLETSHNSLCLGLISSIETLYQNGNLSFRVYDDLGSEYLIQGSILQ
jgi:hypothetical protein